MSAMSTAAFGLQLESSFALPGAAAREMPGLPALRIELMTLDGLEVLWPGPWQQEWTGRLGDGHDLTLERAESGEHRFSYGDRARFVLSEQGERLVCAPATPGLDWQRTLLGKVVPAVSVMRGYEALHAATVQGPGGAVAIAAPSGTGKSTLALELLRRGWPLICDDVLALSPIAGGALAHPGVAQMNVSSTGSDLPSSVRTIGVLGEERWVAVADAAHTACPLAAVVLLARGEDGGIERLDPSPLPLAPYMLGVAFDSRRRAQRFELFAELAQSVPIFKLTVGPQEDPAPSAERLRGALKALGPVP